MNDPYSVINELWLHAPHVEQILSDSNLVSAFAGENDIHSRGFYTDLKPLITSFGSEYWWLVDLDEVRKSISFTDKDDELLYFTRLKDAEDCVPGVPFPYAVRYQGFVSDGVWMLISDRDSERMYFLSKRVLTKEQMSFVSSLFKGNYDQLK